MEKLGSFHFCLAVTASSSLWSSVLKTDSHV